MFLFFFSINLIYDSGGDDGGNDGGDDEVHSNLGDREINQNFKIRSTRSIYVWVQTLIIQFS